MRVWLKAECLVLAACLILGACQGGPQRQNGAEIAVPDSAAALDKAAAIDSGLSYTRFLDSLIVRDSIRYDPPLESFGQVIHWSDEWGSAPADPPRYAFGARSFGLSAAGMQVVNEAGDRLHQIRYDTDTAFTFRFRGRSYGWASTYYFNCNGTGCLERYYLLADFGRNRLHAFVTMAVPSYQDYFGDLNHDGQLDVLIPDYLAYPGSRLPYSDTTEFLTLTAYTLDPSGTVVPIRESGRDCHYMISVRIEDLDARELRILGSHGTFWQ